ncbi:NAD(P)-dependent alcohol dehydrogenase [Kribbella sp. VKM Ac-2568]|uniref:NAD(P)-dependent alcohol dehydrogenase n=1 Tax=Kribbella sp. VKM Ac-2568 TaxID=2512219 RepID=UPI0010500526|nr:NAD(P)-dependent alcohol dehydrogenase [Kribbella sp. VKM Ac-2568]TCM40229.1 NADPH:quinone reductase-like Zn-dependent oxidoreductase [Kribbella sp. VKM Ac-2568]
MSTTTMRAVEYTKYGAADELAVRTVPKPEPRKGQVLIRVHGSSVNPTDLQIRSGKLRMMTGRRFPKRIGLDFAGEVVAVGSGVSDLAVGQRVWGFLGEVSGRTGAAAEFVAAKATAVSLAPSSIELVVAGALPSVGVTALRAVRDVLKVKAGERLLVVGASGGVGSTAIQLACALGAEVTAVSSAPNHAFCRELGASHVVDYTAPGRLSGQFAAILDCHGSSLSTYRRLLRRRGRMMSTAASGMAYAMLSTILPGPRVRVMMARSHREVLAALAEHVDQGDLRPVVEAVYPLAGVARAHREAETGHARGKKLIAVLG